MATFTATHGVEFGEQDEKSGAYVVWAHFEHDRDQDTAEGVKVYTFSTDDEQIAARVRAVNDYGITEVGTPAEAPAEPPVEVPLVEVPPVEVPPEPAV